jgi:CRISPR system Cascade subunit CasB
MSAREDQPHWAADARFIGYLESLVPRGSDKDSRESEHRAVLATLRRGLGRETGTVTEMYRYIGRYLPADAGPWQEDAYFLVGALFAMHPRHSQEGGSHNNLGASFRLLRQKEGSSESIEKRFVALLDASGDTLEHHLRHGISLMRAGEVAVNYLQLLTDIQGWSWDDRAVQRRWARAYWTNAAASVSTTAVNETAATNTAAE